ncbi:MAG TPA: ABC transporter substrate-binding protein, partial [Paracoccaceae bacterium]|nr:ABC transporter substrate-binding protein [Paracoccaceae bacterium]
MNKMLGLVTASALALTAGTAYADRDNQLSDQRVRQAIAYAIDMDTIVETLFEGKAIAADSMIPNGAYKADGLNPYTYDPDMARKLLAEAGWDDSQVLDVVYYYGDQLTADLMVALQAYLADVGIQMTYRKLEGDVGGQLNALPENGSDTSAVTWDIAYGAKAALALQEYYNGYQSGKSSYAPGAPERDALIAAINGTTDVAAQQNSFKEFERYENEVLSDIPLYYQQLFIYESDRLNRNGGQYGNDQFVYDWGIVDWTVSPDENGKSVMYTNSAPASFFEHPWLNPGIYIWSKVGYDHLVNADGSLAPTDGQLAESIDVSADGLSVTFDLVDGVTWQDGAPLTVDDVVWSIETAKAVPGINPVFASTFDAISDIATEG